MVREDFCDEEANAALPLRPRGSSHMFDTHDGPDDAAPTYHPPMAPICKTLATYVRGLLVKCKLAAPPPTAERTIVISGGSHARPGEYSVNMVRNQKYSIFTFLPLSLYEQFKYFFNLYFLVVAISQFYPPLQVGFLFTYVAPLAFVVMVALAKEAYDDVQRFFRDREANGEKYVALVGGENGDEWARVESKDITVGMVLRLKPDQRVPADCVLLATTEKDGSFVRTDQLDGETDWKLRLPVPFANDAKDIASLLALETEIYAEAPHQKIYEFVGSAKKKGQGAEDAVPLSLENTLWADCVLATGHVLVCVIYTGTETRASLNSKSAASKVGQLDTEVNFLAKLLFVITVVLAGFLVICQSVYTAQYIEEWYISLFRFVLLFSSIIPISLRVNLDMGKTVYSYFIGTDAQLEGTIVRNSNLPEELGRIGYLFSDKTGTLTKNEMVFKKLITGSQGPTGWLAGDEPEMKDMLKQAFHQKWFAHGLSSRLAATSRYRSLDRGALDDGDFAECEREDSAVDFTEAASRNQINDLITAFTALAVTHSVTPVVDIATDTKTYQASSPDEVALVTFAETLGLILDYRDRRSMSLKSKPLAVRLTGKVSLKLDDHGHLIESAVGKSGLYTGWHLTEVAGGPVLGADAVNDLMSKSPEGVMVTVEKRLGFDILCEFPFTSESKRMGIVVRQADSGAIYLMMKGADTKMQEIVQDSPWLAEECTNLAREGYRTLVFGAKRLEAQEWELFEAQRKKALRSRDPKGEIDKLRVTIEHNLELVGVTGVEDLLQDDVCKTLEHLRNAGIKVWMLTGDKVETATCIARSTRLVARDGGVFPSDCEGPRYESLWEREDEREGWRPGQAVTTEEQARDFLESFTRFVDLLGESVTMVIDGQSLELLMRLEEEFVESAGAAASVVVARCSPTQKAEVVEIMKKHTAKLTGHRANLRMAAIGDGGNDVSMILAAHVGLGIVGKEGRHASLAADYSFIKFSHCLRLITWHGRNAYKRSARLSQFVIHRGLIISFIQAIFSAIFYFMSVPIYTGWLLVGYSTGYTMLPVFAIVLDEDFSEQYVNMFPELYKELHKSRSLNTRTFLQWVFKALYQGSVIMLLSIVLFEAYFLRIVTITFTALILTELIIVWFEMHKISWPFVVSELVSFILYAASFVALDVLDADYLRSPDFWWKTGTITAVSCAPVIFAKWLERRWFEASYSELREASMQAQGGDSSPAMQLPAPRKRQRQSTNDLIAAPLL
eukprot:TRINITY_DN20283_c0_g1_i1.p1 TRINITY_DN20283_c0_g1~~TRINITY_DN20283_c0_g1_i1.p1  ORF type:complete len:1242 (+),score=448.93 TRINITY_DN20283_c0_g1_i1:93-3818(+)